jgi:DNA-binding MarR family transcriptional regulator
VSTSLLASILGIDPSTASRNLAGLERAGLISRKKGLEDGRQTDVRLTPRGRRMAEEVASDALDALTRLMELVPRQDRPRVTDMLELLARLVDDKRL